MLRRMWAPVRLRSTVEQSTARCVERREEIKACGRCGGRDGRLDAEVLLPGRRPEFDGERPASPTGASHAAVTSARRINTAGTDRRVHPPRRLRPPVRLLALSVGRAPRRPLPPMPSILSVGVRTAAGTLPRRGRFRIVDYELLAESLIRPLSAQYQCPHHHSLHLTEPFLSPREPWPIESSFATFTVNLGGHSYSGRVDGVFALGGGATAFGTLEASTVTRYGHCRTGLVPWAT